MKTFPLLRVLRSARKPLPISKGVGFPLGQVAGSQVSKARPGAPIVLTGTVGAARKKLQIPRLRSG